MNIHELWLALLFLVLFFTGTLLLVVGWISDRRARRDMLDDGYDRRRNSRLRG
jgi:hypothetical protein